MNDKSRPLRGKSVFPEPFMHFQNKYERAVMAGMYIAC